MSTKGIVVGKDCTIREVVLTLKSSEFFHMFHGQWREIAAMLNTPREKVEKLGDDYRLNMKTLMVVVADLIEDWVSRKGEHATIQILCRVLEEAGLTSCSECLQNTLTGKDSEGEPAGASVKKYREIPNTLQEFMNGDVKFCIITTLDNTITCEKITENVPYCFEWKGFLHFLSSSKGRDKTVVDIVVGCTIKNMKQLNRVEPNGASKVLFITCEDEEKVKEVVGKQDSLKNKVLVCRDEMKWDDLTLSYQLEITDKLETKYGIDLDDVKFDGQILANLINGKEIRLFTETLPSELGYYVERRILTRYFISFKIFEKQSEAILLFTGMELYQLSSFSKNQVPDYSRNQIRHAKVTVNYLILDQPNHFEKICRKSDGKPVHLLRYENSKLRWVKSRGSMEAIQECVDKSQGLEEDNFCFDVCSSSSQVVCLADSPGMGKSVLLAQFGRKLKEMHPERLIFFVELSQFIKALEETDTEEDNPKKNEPTATSDTIKTVLTKIVCENAVGKAVLVSKLNSDDKILIELLLDGFDEVDSADSEFPLEILNKIRTSFTPVRMWITSRSHFLETIENSLSILAYNILAFSTEDQLKFLTTFWTTGSKHPLNNERLLKFANHCLTSLKERMDSTDEDIAGIPLQCLLIGQVYEEDAIDYAAFSNDSTSEVHIDDIGTITSLYHRLIVKKIAKYESFSRVTNLDKRKTMEMHVKLSLQLINPREFPKLKYLFGSLKVDERELLKIGIVESSGSAKSPIRFIHRTFAEYFIAWFVTERLRGEWNWDEQITEFFLKSVCGFRDWQRMTQHIRAIHTDDFKAIQFTCPVISYFINSIITDFQTKNINIPAHVISKITQSSSKSQQTLSEIALACACVDLVGIFNLFNDMNAFDIHSSEIFTEDFLIICVITSGLQIIEESFIHFERHHQRLEMKLKNRLFNAAIRQGNTLSVEYLIREQGLTGFVERNNGLLRDLVKDTQKDGVSVIQRKIQIMHTLQIINKNMLEDKKPVDGWPPLLMRDVHVRLLVELIRLGADVTVQDYRGNTVFQRVSEFTNADYHSLVSSIPEESLKKVVHVAGGYNNQQYTPLLSILESIDPFPKTLAILKAAGADFNFKNENYSFPIVLSTAVEYGRSADTLQNLIKHGSDVDWKNDSGLSLIHLTALRGHTDALKLLIQEHMPSITFENPYDGLSWESPNHGSSSDDGQCVEPISNLIKDDNKLNRIVDRDGGSPLHCAAQRGALDCIRYLISLGVDVNQVDRKENTPLHYGVEYEHSWGVWSKTKVDHFSVIKILLENNAKPNLLNQQKETAFHKAVNKEGISFKTIQLLKSKTNVKWTQLLAHRAFICLVTQDTGPTEDEFSSLVRECADDGVTFDINFMEDNEDPLMHRAAERQYKDVLQFLVKVGVSVNSRDKQRQTALHRAANEKGGDSEFRLNLKIIRFLIDSGADVYAKDDKNQNFLHHYISNASFGVQCSDVSSMLEYIKTNGYSDLFETKRNGDGMTPLQLASQANLSILGSNRFQ